LENRLQIVSLDVPYPPDYGGVVDIFYTIKHLHDAGVKIILHCFEYGRGKQPELETLCERVYYYPRKKIFSFSIPYFVISRKNNLLRDRLRQYDMPVLLEGIHCSYHFFKDELPGTTWIRMSNVEYEYYFELFKNERNIFYKLYYLWESRLLKSYEQSVIQKGKFLAVSHHDEKIYKSKGGQCSYLSLMIQSANINSKPGSGNYCLYHGNLSVPENEQVAIFLIQKIFSKLNISFIIAGRSPSKKLLKTGKKNSISIISDPDETEMNFLISNAHIHILPSFNSTGTKIKIIYALQFGRHVITNKNAIQESGLDSLCHIYESDDQLIDLIQQLMTLPLGDEEISKRKKIFYEEFNPAKNTRHLMDILFNQPQ